MKHNFAKKLDWKKVILGILGGFVTFLIIGVIVVFAWMQTWKKYELPDHQGSFSYQPALFVLPIQANIAGPIDLIKLSSNNDVSNRPAPAGNFFFNMNRYSFKDDSSAAKDFPERIRSTVEYEKQALQMAEISTSRLTIGEKDAALIDLSESNSLAREYLLVHNQYIYQINASVSGPLIFRLAYGWILDQMIKSIRFN